MQCAHAVNMARVHEKLGDLDAAIALVLAFPCSPAPLVSYLHYLHLASSLRVSHLLFLGRGRFEHLHVPHTRCRS